METTRYGDFHIHYEAFWTTPAKLCFWKFRDRGKDMGMFDEKDYGLMIPLRMA